MPMVRQIAPMMRHKDKSCRGLHPVRLIRAGLFWNVDYVWVLALFFLFGCSWTQKEAVIPEIRDIDIVVKGIEIDTLYLEREYFSGVGFFAMGSDTLFFVDQIFASIHVYDHLGRFSGSFLGKGEGPENQNNIHGFSPYANEGNHLVLDNFELVQFDGSFKKTDKWPLEWEYSDSYSEMLNRPSGKMLGLYEVNWMGNGANTNFELFGTPGTEEVLIPITMTHPLLNGYLSEEYYEEVSILGRYSLKSKRVVQGIGLRSKEYLSNKFVPNFDFFQFETVGDSIFVSFAIDPLIHVFDREGRLLMLFGSDGTNMKKDYPKTNTIEDALDRYALDLEMAGYFDHLYVEPQSGMVFRGYFQNGRLDQTSRLQIYDRFKLIGDLEVPGRFRVIGKAGDFYYADGIVNEENDKLAIYRFKLKH